MVIGFKVKFYWFQVGSGSFLHSFFSTICYHLEQKKWGSKYPLLMNDLYNGCLDSGNLDDALSELEEIITKLGEIAPSEVIWDIEDLSQKPPWGDNISQEITNLGNYFVTSDGDDLITVLKSALQKAKELNMALTIEAL